MRARLYPSPDRVLYGTPYYGRRARVDDVLAANNGTERSYKPLSDFLSSMAELRMGKDVELAEQAQCLSNCRHEFSKGISASIVLKAKVLTAACKNLETAFVLTSVTPRYPCCSGKQIYNIDQKTGYN